VAAASRPRQPPEPRRVRTRHRLTAAAQTLADRRRFVLDEARWLAFEQALDRPIQARPRLE